MFLNDITPLVLTFNEAPNVGRVLDRLTWAERIVVVDSGSTDETLEIVACYPQVEVFHRPFDEHHRQWNFGLEQIETKSVLTLDADYALSEALVDEIRALPDDAEVVGYRARFVYCIEGRPLRGTLYPPRVALFRVDRARYEQDGHTQRLNLNGPVRDLHHPIYHDDRKPLARWLANQSVYARLEAKKLRTTSPEHLSRVDRLRRQGWIVPFLTPLYCLIGKGLILDGRAGLTYTLQRTYAEVLLARKLRERKAADRMAAAGRRDRAIGSREPYSVADDGSAEQVTRSILE